MSNYIWLFISLLFIGKALAQEDNVEIKSITQEIANLKRKAENISTEIQQFVGKLKENITTALHKYPMQSYMKIFQQITTENQCISLKNSLILISSNISKTITDCYRGARILVKSLLEMSNRVRDEIMQELTKNLNRLPQIPQISTTESMPISKFMVNVAENFSMEHIKSRIDVIKKLLEKLDITKKIEEFEIILNSKICGTVAISYEEEIKNLISALKECFISEEDSTINKPSTTETTEKVATNITEEMIRSARKPFTPLNLFRT